MLWLFVIFKGLLSCCFEVTLITIEIDPFMFLLFVKSQTTFVLCFVLTLITITYYPLMFRLFVHTQMTFLCCLVLTVITIRFDIHVFWFFMNPKIDFLHFQGALLCSFVFHISIECALSDFFWFLLCTHIDHNQISCLRAQIDYESWEFACTMFSCFDCLCTLKIPFCVALITVKSKPLHVSIECAFLDYLLCCFVLTLFTIKFDHLMLR